MQATVQPSHPRPEWVERFAIRAMAVRPSIDSMSAFMIAEGQFDDAADLEPEQAADIFAAPRWTAAPTSSAGRLNFNSKAWL